MTTKRTCSVDGCERPYRCKGFCNIHYRRNRKWGDPLRTYGPEDLRVNWLVEMIESGDRSVCWEWPYSRMSFGYGRARYKGSTWSTHQIALDLVGRPVADGDVTRHLCNNPPCCNPDHLRGGSQRENAADTVRAGNSTRGEKNATSKLTNGEVLEIAQRCKAGESHVDIAKDFNVSRPNISMISAGRTWSWLTGIGH